MKRFFLIEDIKNCRPIWQLLLAFCLLFTTAYSADAKRVALVVGNSKYEQVAKLTNPENDARDIASALRRIGFEVTEQYDLDYRQMRLSLRDFSENAADADVVLIYFAGHGIEINNTNYLIPVNAELRSERDIEFEAVRLETVVNAVIPSKGLNIVLVDACRNNPFLSRMNRSTASRSIGKGLARIDPSGVLVGYSARGGTLALDGEGRNSPYAIALLEHIEVPGLELGKLFRKVRDSVFEQTKGYQEPFTYGSLPGLDIFLVPAVAKVEKSEIVSNTPEKTEDKIDEREASAERVLSEALKLEDESVRLGALDMIARLYPDTQAGLAAKSAVASLTPKNEPEEKSIAQPDTSANEQTTTENDEKPILSIIANDAERRTEQALNLGPSEYRAVQSGLNFLGFSVGPVDGIFGTRSRNALREFQSKNGEPRTGYLTAETYAVLKRNAQQETRSSQAPEKPSTASQVLPQEKSSGETVSGYNGVYTINIRRRPDRLYHDPEVASEENKTVLWLKYRKTDDNFQLVSAIDRTAGGDRRPKKYRASLNDKGRLRISGRTGYLFGKVREEHFSISLNLPPNFGKGKSVRSIQGRFDEAYYVDVTITRE
ncbi:MULTISPECIES: caspase family protein [unclassified Ruegeria]|uniref:caspase family protein n=1 Tax=unclassified Ruegeria TaxID=2625375 RepID=UPI001489DBFB|nr:MULTISPECIES: caspase family protein [unclassified Ruegeria]